MSKSSKERGDLKLRRSGNTKLIAFWTCVSRILRHHPTFIGNRKQPSVQSFYVSHERETTKKYIRAWFDQRRHFPSQLHVMESLEMNARYWSATKPCRKPLSPRNQESLILTLQTSWSQGWVVLQLYEVSRAEWAKITSGKMKSASACSIS